MATAKELTTGPGGNNTVVGQSILISGKLTGDEDLTVRGRVEGELTLSRTLIVEPSGVVKANVAVRNAIVSGVVVGNINATESVELTREGRMVGDIRSPRVIIVDGASFRGRVDMGEVEPGRVPADRPTATRPVAAARPATVRPGAAPPRPPLPPARPAAAAPAPAPAAAARPPLARAMGKPLPPPPPAKGEGKPEPAKASPLAPAPPLVGAAKRKVILKPKRGR